MENILIVRHVHVLAASAWFGEVVVINFILLPVVAKLTGEMRKRFLATVFPRIFRAASVLSATTALSGGVLVWNHTSGNLAVLTGGGRWATCVLIAGCMGLALTLFHFFMEDKMARRLGIGRADTADAVLEDIHVKLKIVPRIGMGVISTIFVLMMYAVRGA